MALDFNPKFSNSTETLSGVLIGAPEDVFDRASVEADITRDMADLKDVAEQRRMIAKTLSAEYEAARVRIADHFAANPYDTQKVIRTYTYIADQVVQIAAQIVITAMYPVSAKTQKRTIVFGCSRGVWAR